MARVTTAVCTAVTGHQPGDWPASAWCGSSYMQRKLTLCPRHTVQNLAPETGSMAPVSGADFSYQLQNFWHQEHKP